MTHDPYRIPRVSDRGSRPRLVCSTLPALALGLLGAGAAYAANLTPMFKHQAPRVTQGAPTPHLAAPRVTTLSATAALQHNCSGPQPIFIARVTLHNAGGPLAANRGLVSVSDTNSGTYHGKSLRLVSAGIAIPAIAPNANRVVTVPISSLAPYAGEVGVKRLTVRVLPTTYSGKPAFLRPPFYVYTATVPSGFCATHLSVPRPGTGQFSIPPRGRRLP